MRHLVKKAFSAVCFGVVVALCILVLASGGKSSTYAAGIDCKDVVVIYLRGSGEPGFTYGSRDYKNALHPKEADKKPQLVEGDVLFNSVRSNIPADKTTEFINLNRAPKFGAQYVEDNKIETDNERLSGWGYTRDGYPAADAFKATSVGNLVEAKWPGLDSLGGYNESVASGAEELTLFLTDRVNQCPDQEIVLGGFSQGAEAVGEALFKLSNETASHISYVALFGDPKFNPGLTLKNDPLLMRVVKHSMDSSLNFSDPIGLGTHTGFFNWSAKTPNAAKVAGSPWLRGDFEYASYGGILGPRKDYIPDQFYGKVGSWCLARDFVCSSVVQPIDIKNHDNYEFQYVPAAGEEIGERLTQIFKSKVSAKVLGASTAVEHKKPTDIMIVRDASVAAQSHNDTMAQISNLYAKSLAREYPDSRVGVINYCGMSGSQAMGATLTDLTLPLSDNPKSIADALKSPRQNCYGQATQATGMYSGIWAAMDQGLGWRPEANRVIIVMASSKPNVFYNEGVYAEPKSGLTEAMIISRAGINKTKIFTLQDYSYEHDTVRPYLLNLAQNTGGGYHYTLGAQSVLDLSYLLNYQDKERPIFIGYGNGSYGP
jgi:hypothetical protein